MSFVGDVNKQSTACIVIITSSGRMRYKHVLVSGVQIPETCRAGRESKWSFTYFGSTTKNRDHPV